MQRVLFITLCGVAVAVSLAASGWKIGVRSEANTNRSQENELVLYAFICETLAIQREVNSPNAVIYLQRFNAIFDQLGVQPCK